MALSNYGGLAMMMSDCHYLLLIIARIESLIIEERKKHPELLKLSDEEFFLIFKHVIEKN